MQIDILTSNFDHPGLNDIKNYVHEDSSEPNLSLGIYDTVSDLRREGVLFLISYQEKINLEDFYSYDHIIVFHASDLPKGRGWSPYIWDILSGAETITVCAISAAEKIDCGDVWAKTFFKVARTDFLNDILEKISNAQLELLKRVVSMVNNCEFPTPQDQRIKPTYFSRRTPKDSFLDPDKTLNQLFDQIRMSDRTRFPAIVEIHGEKFNVIMERLNDQKYEDR
jgi:methionyl-tRNA formyltransferase